MQNEALLKGFILKHADLSDWKELSSPTILKKHTRIQIKSETQAMIDNLIRQKMKNPWQV